MHVVIVNVYFLPHYFRMEEEPNSVVVEPTIPPPPSTPGPRTFKVGDLVQVFNGTEPNVRAARTVAYVGIIVGYNNEFGKWEVHFITLITPSS